MTVKLNPNGLREYLNQITLAVKKKLDIEIHQQLLTYQSDLGLIRDN